MIAVTLKNVATHFDKAAIMTPAEKAQNKLLGKFGAYVRRTQMNSLKRAKRGEVSQPGKPPLRHAVRPDIKNTVFFFVDRPRKDVVIGMVLLSEKPSGELAMPGVLEHGGNTRLVSLRNQLLAMESREGKELTKRGGKMVVGKVEGRPSATPAFEKVIKRQLPDLIKGGIMREV